MGNNQSIAPDMSSYSGSAPLNMQLADESAIGARTQIMQDYQNIMSQPPIMMPQTPEMPVSSYSAPMRDKKQTDQMYIKSLKADVRTYQALEINVNNIAIATDRNIFNEIQSNKGFLGGATHILTEACEHTSTLPITSENIEALKDIKELRPTLMRSLSTRDFPDAMIPRDTKDLIDFLTSKRCTLYVNRQEVMIIKKSYERAIQILYKDKDDHEAYAQKKIAEVKKILAINLAAAIRMGISIETLKR